MTLIKQAIIVEDRFKEVLAKMPNFVNPDTETSHKYHIKIGPDEEINAYLKKAKQPYPLIWLTYPYLEKHLLKKVDVKNISFVIAVTGNTKTLLDDRFENNYKNRLMPMFSVFKHVIEKSNTINTNEEYGIIKFPNYSKADKNSSIDIWDAIKITFDCTINNNCLKLNI